MNKRKSAIDAVPKSEIKLAQDYDTAPMDTLVLKVLSLRVSDQDLRNHLIKVSFFDQLLVHAVITPVGSRDQEPRRPLTVGKMLYDPADYEKICLFSDYPLVAQIHPVKIADVNQSTVFTDPTNIEKEVAANISCCNVDIMSFFLEMKSKKKMRIQKRMEPMIPPSALKCKSWDTLPLLTMELTIEQDSLNSANHELIRNANWMKLTLIACYNMYIPYENDYVYTAASRIPVYNDGEGTNFGLVTYSQGYSEAKRFDGMSFYPKWESLRCLGEVFTQGDKKFQCTPEEIRNENKIDLQHYLNKKMSKYTSVWGSFHRTLMLNGDRWLWKHLRYNKWPVEIHIYGDTGGYSFMAFLNLFQLLYPGEHTMRIAVPLQWINAESMMTECGCDLLLTPNDKPPSIGNDKEPLLSLRPESSRASRIYSTITVPAVQWVSTGFDDNDAFIIVEVQLRRPLMPIIEPPPIPTRDISAMLTQMELKAPKNRICTGRGQLEHEWSKTMRSAANALRKVPYYGAELCSFNRQLSETRTRVQLTTSCWQDAAIFVNNHFVVQEHLKSEEDYEEMLMMAHACLMKSASSTLMRTSTTVEADPILRAARCARQMQDMHHAKAIYLRLIVQHPRNATYWRELSTCMKDIDRDWARVCLTEAIVINPRHPLTLLSQGTMMFEENPAAAEPFFIALLTFHPTWTTAWTIASVFFYERQLFHMAEVIMKIAEKWGNLRCREDLTFQRSWQHELGDWWDTTPLTPGMSLYYDAADLLLRLRAVPLAEVCISRVLSVTGETPQYYHLVGLCCRLRGDYQDALCHLTAGLNKFGEVYYLRSLEAEVQHKLGNIENAIASFGKISSFFEPFSTLMSLSCIEKQRTRAVLLDLVRRKPCAHAWTALAEDWLTDLPTKKALCESETKNEAEVQTKCKVIACGMQALKLDRQAGRAWAILSMLVKPRAKRLYCLHMAEICGWEMAEEDINLAKESSRHSFCHKVGTRLRECRCTVCDRTRL